MSQFHESESSSSIEWLSVTPDSFSPEPPATDPRPADDPLIGTTLRDTYVIDHVIGEGGMGRVYHAHHASMESKHFAIKVLRPEVLPSPQVRARFEREAEAVACIDHPGIVSVVDAGKTPEGAPYMVCERLVGVDQRLYCRRFGKFSNEKLIHLGKQLAAALGACHAAGVIHRDLKPSNVYLLGDFLSLSPPLKPRIKILDFGLSRFLDRDERLTHTGLVMGTPGYMAPEQAQALSTDHRTDVYGVGAVLYAAATGRAPFREANPQQTVLAVLSREARRPRELNPTLSEGIEALIQRCLAKDPDDRFQSMEELHAALEALEPEADVEAPLAGVRWGARPAVVATTLLGSLLLAAALASAAAGLLSAWLDGATSHGLSLALLVSAAGLGLAPGLALARRYQRDWQSSLAMQRWRARLEPALAWSLIAYGVAALGLRLTDGVAARWMRAPGAGGEANGVLDALLVLVALFAGAASFGSRAPMVDSPRAVRPFARELAFRAAVVLVGAGLLATGWHWQAGEPRATAPILADAARLEVERLALEPLEPVPSKPAPSPDEAAAVATETPPGALAPTASSPLDPQPDVDGAVALASGASRRRRATLGELTAAVAGGSSDLETLSQRYPRDADVLKALVLSHSSRSAGIADAARAIGRLLDVEPARRSDPDVRYILKRAARRDGASSDAAFEVMREHMGSAGPDLMYELLRRGELTERAGRELSSVREQFTPELAIAYELRFAPSCKARLGLLERAERLGDQRSINALSALVSKPRRCGKRSTGECAVRCESQQEPFSRSIGIISERLRAAERTARREAQATPSSSPPL